MTTGDTPDATGLHVICAWCGFVVSQGAGDRVSHGICNECAPKVLDQVRARLDSDRTGGHSVHGDTPVEAPLDEP